MAPRSITVESASEQAQPPPSTVTDRALWEALMNYYTRFFGPEHVNDPTSNRPLDPTIMAHRDILKAAFVKLEGGVEKFEWTMAGMLSHMQDAQANPVPEPTEAGQEDLPMCQRPAAAGVPACNGKMCVRQGKFMPPSAFRNYNCDNCKVPVRDLKFKWGKGWLMCRNFGSYMCDVLQCPACQAAKRAPGVPNEPEDSDPGVPNEPEDSK